MYKRFICSVIGMLSLGALSAPTLCQISSGVSDNRIKITTNVSEPKRLSKKELILNINYRIQNISDEVTLFGKEHVMCSVWRITWPQEGVNGQSLLINNSFSRIPSNGSDEVTGTVVTLAQNDIFDAFCKLVVPYNLINLDGSKGRKSVDLSIETNIVTWRDDASKRTQLTDRMKTQGKIFWVEPIVTTFNFRVEGDVKRMERKRTSVGQLGQKK